MRFTYSKCMTGRELAAAVAVVVRAWHLPRRMYVELEPLLGCSLKRDFGVGLCVECSVEYRMVRSDQRFCSRVCRVKYANREGYRARRRSVLGKHNNGRHGRKR